MSSDSRAVRARTLWRPALSWLALALALWWLNFILSFHNLWPTLWIESRNELSIEIAVLLLGLALWSERRSPPSGRALTGIALVLLFMGIGRYFEVTVAGQYGRPVNLYWDGQHLPDVAAMLVKVAPPWYIAAGLVGLAALLCAVFVSLRSALRCVARGLAVPVERRAIAALSGTLVLLYTLGTTDFFPLRTLHWFSLPVTRTYEQQIGFLVHAWKEDRYGGTLPPPVDFGNSELTRLAGADVLLIFMESYGATSYDTDWMAAELADARARLEATVESTGRQVVSAFVTSPTFGGVSWLAHSSFMTGLPIRDNGTYNLLLTQHRDTLPRRFERIGYRAIAWMPGLRQNWPEGSFYGFDRIYGEDDLAYRGPDFGWWRLPDQYSLAKLDASELRGSPRQPRFVFFPTISTHIPFRPTPPYQPDWARVLTATPFDAGPLQASLAQGPDWTDPGRGYAASLSYTYEYLRGYLAARPNADFVMILLGDHQPAASVSGEGARWDVPVHVIASRPQIVDALRRAGFTDGMTPRDAAIGPMYQLAPLLLRAFGDGADVSRAEPRPQPAPSDDLNRAARR